MVCPTISCTIYEGPTRQPAAAADPFFMVNQKGDAANKSQTDQN